jgi:hypothetical protein
VGFTVGAAEGEKVLTTAALAAAAVYPLLCSADVIAVGVRELVIAAAETVAGAVIV